MQDPMPMEMKKTVDILSELFGEVFITDDFLQYGKAKSFQCVYKDECKFHETDETSMTPVVVNKNGTSTILVLMEAPSSTNPGAWISGKFEDWSSNGKLYYQLFLLISQSFPRHRILVTDVIKCGVAKQRDKNILAIRRDRCIETFLNKEIEAFAPDKIFCIGRSAEILSKSVRGNRSTYYLVHPSGRVKMSAVKKREMWQRVLQEAGGLAN